MIKKLDIADPNTAKKVLDIQKPSYMVEAEIINFFEIPPLMDTVEKLQRSEEIFYGYFIEDELCGAISLKKDNGVIDIHRLMVHPNHFRKGIAQKLLDYIQAEDHHTVIVSTGSLNTPAILFYQKNGFAKTGEIEITETLSITSFKKEYTNELIY